MTRNKPVKDDDEDDVDEQETSIPDPQEATNKKDTTNKESFGETVQRKSRNCWAATGLCCFKFAQRTSVQQHQFAINNRKKKFGVDYLTLIEEQASQATLKKCLQQALNDIAELQAKIDEHEDKVEAKEREVQAQIQEPPRASAKKDDEVDSFDEPPKHMPKVKPSSTTPSEKTKRMSNSNNNSSKKDQGPPRSISATSSKPPKEGEEKVRRKSSKVKKTSSANNNNDGSQEAGEAPKQKKKKKKKPPTSSSGESFTPSHPVDQID